MTSKRKQTRSKRQQSGGERCIKEKFLHETYSGLDGFIPTLEQRDLINKIKGHTLTFVDSEAGTGKTSSVLWHFCKEYLRDPSKQIYVVRTPVEAGGDKIGFLPNSEQEKLAPHFASAKILLEKFLGKGKVETELGKSIHFKVPNFMLGCTLDNALVLLDECQQLQPLILKLLLERTGQNTKVVIAGSSSQVYASDKARNALDDAINRFFVDNGDYIEAKYNDMAYHEFSLDECHRSDVVKDVIRAYRG